MTQWVLDFPHGKIEENPAYVFLVSLDAVLGMDLLRGMNVDGGACFQVAIEGDRERSFR